VSTVSPVQGASPDNQVVMPLLDHLKELRNRLIKIAIALLIATVASLVFAKQAVVILISRWVTTCPRPSNRRGAINYMKVALICGVTLAMPVIVYQIGRFVTPGLSSKEKRYLWLLVPAPRCASLPG